MAREKAARRSCNYERANVSSCARDTASITENLRRDYERGTLLVGVGMVLVWGPLVVMHAMGVF